MNPLLTSSSNPKIKYLLSLEKSRTRRDEKRFIIEGFKEIIQAKKAGYVLETVFYYPDLIAEESLRKAGIPEAICYPVNKVVFEKIAYRETTTGVVAIAEQRDTSLDAIQLTENPLVLVVEAIEKPGNLGALLRTADAAGVDAVISCDPMTDFYNPNTVRSSLGGVFTNQIVTASSEETIQWLKSNKIKIFCTYLEASSSYTKVDYTGPTAIVMGSEAKGLTRIWVENSDANIIIPMKGTIDSMNVSVSAAIVTFEAIRQRDK